MSLKSRTAGKAVLGGSVRRGNRLENGLWPYQSSRGGRPDGSRIQLRKSRGGTPPIENVFPPITMFFLLSPLRAPYATSNNEAYRLGATGLLAGAGLKVFPLGSPQIIHM